MPRRRGASGASHGRLGPALRRRVRCGPGGELGVRLFIAGPEAPHVWPRIGIHDSRGARPYRRARTRCAAPFPTAPPFCLCVRLEPGTSQSQSLFMALYLPEVLVEYQLTSAEVR